MSEIQRKVYQLNATYQVMPGASFDDLMSDASMCLDAVESGLNLLAIVCSETEVGLDGKRLSSLISGLGYLTSMAAGISDIAHGQGLRMGIAVQEGVRHD